MSQLTLYRHALCAALFALLLLGFGYNHKREHVGRLVKWGNEDAEIILAQEVTIEDLREKLNAEKKAHVGTSKRLAAWEAKYPLQAEEFRTAQQESKRITVVANSDGSGTLLVASIPDGKTDSAIEHLQKNNVDAYDSCGLGVCGLYVSVQDFDKAAELLRQIKPQLEKGVKAGRPRVSITGE